MTTRWQVEMLIGNTWENVWQEDDEPMTFATRAQARTELADYRDSMTVEQANDRERFRIVKVKP